MPANAFEASHERTRLYWVADSGCEGWKGYKSIECMPSDSGPAFTEYGYPLVDAREALESDNEYILLGDGISVAVERCATKGYGNAIVPQEAATFIKAYMLK